MIKKILFPALLCLLAACSTDGPRKPLDALASALESRNSAEFMSQLNWPAFRDNALQEIIRSDFTLNILNDMGELVGVRMDRILDRVSDIGDELAQELQEGVATGDLTAHCRKTLNPNCPWVASSLRDARVVKLDDTAAVAQVTTPAAITSWLALARIAGHWQVVGQTPMEQSARQMAVAAAASAPVSPPRAAQEAPAEGRKATPAPISPPDAASAPPAKGPFGI